MQLDSRVPAYATVGVGVVGAGYWGQKMLRALRGSTRTRLVQICDHDAAALANVPGIDARTRTTTQFEDLLVDEDIDAVFIATPPATHATFASAALRAGKHVLVEKPLATTLADAKALLELAAAHERTLMVGHTFLYSPPVIKLQQLIAGGTMGDIFYIESQRVNLGRYQDVGVLWDLAPHDLSIILFWLGEVPCGVSATGRSFVSGEREDVVFVNLDFPSGVIAQVHVSWRSPVKLRRILVSGSERMAVYDDAAGPQALKIFRHDLSRERDVWIPRLADTEPLRAEWDHFLDCILTGDAPRSDVRSGSLVVQIMEAADRALASGRREPVAVNLPQPRRR